MLATYAELKGALARLLNRADLEADIPGFIALFEADFDGREDTARHRRRVCRSQAVIAGEYETLPANFMAVQSAALAGPPPRQLRYLEPDALTALIEAAAGRAAGEAPRCYSIVGTEIRFFPAPQSPCLCDLTVYERLPRLSEAADANWLLSYFPQVYLYGAALHSAPFLGADERLAAWRGLYEDAVAKCARADPPPTAKGRLRTDLIPHGEGAC